MDRNEGVTSSSGNVFADLGLSNPEDHMVKAQLAVQIKRFIKNKGWKQAQAAEIIGIGQPKLSQILRGELSGISIDRLMKIVMRLGHSIEVRISEEERAPDEVQLLVRVA